MSPDLSDVRSRTTPCLPAPADPPLPRLPPLCAGRALLPTGAAPQVGGVGAAPDTVHHGAGGQVEEKAAACDRWWRRAAPHLTPPARGRPCWPGRSGWGWLMLQVTNVGPWVMFSDG